MRRDQQQLPRRSSQPTMSQLARAPHRSCSRLAASDAGRPTSTNFSTQLILSGRPAW